MMGRIATITLMILAMAAGMARGQLNVGKRGPDGRTATLGQKTEDPEKEKKRMAKRCRHHIAKAREHLAAERWGKARESLNMAQSVAVERSLALEILDIYKQLDAEGARLLAQADKLYNEGKYLEALKSYGRISREFASLPVGWSAAAALRSAKNDPVVRNYIQEAAAQVLAELANRKIAAFFRAKARSTTKPATKPAKAPTSMPAGRVEQIRQLDIETQLEVVDLLKKIAKLYGSSPTGKKAVADLETLKQDKPLQQRLARHRLARKARQAFKLAEMYHAGGLLEKAAEYYREVIRKYPETPEAEEAEKALIDLAPEPAAKK